MGTMERVIDMQNQGMPDSEIIAALRNEGISAKEINDSLAQARIKMAVSQEDTSSGVYQESYQGQEQAMPPEAQPQEQYQYQDQQAYQQQGYYPEQPQINVETISEIVERIISEKTRDINSKIKMISDFKSKTEEDINELKERVKRIEASMDTLQKAVITKVGEISQSTALVHKDLDNLHGTVSKLMNPLVDNYNELKKFNDTHNK